MTPRPRGTAREVHAPAARILGRPVPLLRPSDGPVYVLVLGEAPGPRGADKSGIPFFGDAAGRPLYAVFERLGAATLPAGVDDLPWDGARFAAAGYVPRLRGIALTNAFDRCPTDDGHRFRAPTRAELESAANFERLRLELQRLRADGLSGVVTLGRVPARTMAAFFQEHPMPELVSRALPHPSAQGLLSMVPDRGRGAKMSDLQALWMARCEAALLEAGLPVLMEARS